MVEKMADDLDDVVIKGLSSPERRNILRIVASYAEGVSYTGILGESGLSTGRLNYHLGELTGFVKSGEDRRYRLTELGKKAVSVLSFIREDVDAGLLETVNTKRSKRLKSIRRRMDYGFYFLGLILLGVTCVMGTIAEAEGDPVLRAFTGFWVLFSVGLMFLVNRSRNRDPERILWLVEWLEWKLFGNYRARPQ
ncbi:MAG: hypothetical protein JSV27_02800 [Candidatus Bathyarchaeota archaeon]|nr:MAG: hypothetical protein JSV27_02800 [Candidatus Bathyarchaeota archaeon]